MIKHGWFVSMSVAFIVGCSSGAAEDGVEDGALEESPVRHRCGAAVASDAPVRARCINPQDIVPNPHAYVDMVRSRNGEYSFVIRVHAADVPRGGEDLALVESNPYQSQGAAELGLGAMVRAIRERSYELSSTGSEHYFVVNSPANRRSLGTSALFSSEQEAHGGFAKLKAAFDSTDVTIDGEEVDERSHWKVSDEGFALIAANGIEMLSNTSEISTGPNMVDAAFAVHEAGAMDRVALLRLSTEQIASVCATAERQKGTVRLTEHLAVRVDASGMFSPVVAIGGDGPVVPGAGESLAQGNSFTECRGAVDSLRRVTRILDRMPRG